MGGQDIDVEELGASFRAVLDDICTPDNVRRHVDGDPRPLAALRDQARGLGWFALIAPEEHGGLALGPAATMALYEELGRSVAPLPVVGALAATSALALAGAESQRAAWLPRLAAGELVVGIAAGAFDPQWDAIVVARRGDAVVLNGGARDVLDGATADLFLLPATNTDGARCWVLAPAEAATVIESPLVDRTRTMAEVRFSDAVVAGATVLDASASVVAREVYLHACMALSADAIGGARAVLDMTVAYLKTREQFGKPIGSFQALKHRCADHAVALEAASTLVRDAAVRWSAQDPAIESCAAMAKALACDVYAVLVTDAVQLHGGIGYTWEHMCHIYLKRAKLSQVLFGGSSAHRDHAARLILAAHGSSR